METIGHLFTTLPWPVEEFQRARALMGNDFWSYGVEPNRRELEAVARYAHEQRDQSARSGARGTVRPIDVVPREDLTLLGSGPQFTGGGLDKEHAPRLIRRDIRSRQ